MSSRHCLDIELLLSNCYCLDIWTVTIHLLLSNRYCLDIELFLSNCYYLDIEHWIVTIQLLLSRHLNRYCPTVFI